MRFNAGLGSAIASAGPGTTSIARIGLGILRNNNATNVAGISQFLIAIRTFQNNSPVSFDNILENGLGVLHDLDDVAWPKGPP